MSEFRFGSGSLGKLLTCHPILQEILQTAIKHSNMDFAVLSGWRGEAEQTRLLSEGRSKVAFPDSQHNHVSDERDEREGFAAESGLPLSMAADIAPWYPTVPHIRWNRTDEFRWLAGFVMGIGEPIARKYGFTLRWGGDWDRDGDHSLQDNPFMDLPHIELRRIQ